MSYKIAIATSDGINIDISFGAAQSFSIYEAEGSTYKLAEQRKYVPEDTEEPPASLEKTAQTPENSLNGTGNIKSTPEKENNKNGCASSGTCGSGGGGCGTSGGCGGAGGKIQKVEMLSDCRCIVCRKIGFNVQKQLEKKAIISFDIDCSVEEALKKITLYLEKTDKHMSLRGIARRQSENN